MNAWHIKRSCKEDFMKIGAEMSDILDPLSDQWKGSIGGECMVRGTD
jgi:hypothetical protein